MHSTNSAIARPARPGDTIWNAYVRRMMDPNHRLVLRWCTHLAFEDVMRIDHGSIHAAGHESKRDLGTWRMAFGNGCLPATIVPASLVRITQRLIAERAHALSIAARHDEPVFTEAYGEQITRESLLEAIRRAIVLVRLSDRFLSR